MGGEQCQGRRDCLDVERQIERNSQVSRIINEGARWLLLVNIAVACWLWGGTRPWTKEVIGWLLLADLVIFLSALIIRRKLPAVPAWAFWPGAVLLFVGWVLALNSYPGDAGVRILLDHFPGKIAWLPSYGDASSSIREMLFFTGLMGGFWISCDMASNRQWLLRLWNTIALVGVSIVTLGLLQRLTKAPSIFWNFHEQAGGFFFAVFRYHGNAGAFINLVFPIIAALAVRSSMRRGERAPRVFWTISAVVTVAAAFVNVSRAAEILTVVLFLGWLIWLSLLLRGMGESYGNKLPISAVLSLVLLIPVMVASLGFQKSLTRWKRSSSGMEISTFEGDRFLTYRSIVRHVMPRSGFFGSGPGSFEPVFAAVVAMDDIPARGRWDVAHNDHLQAAVEWGWVGYACWLMLFLGVFRAGVRLARKGDSLSLKLLGASGVVSLGGIFVHAMVDFPLQIPSLVLLTACIAGMLAGAPLQGWRQRRQEFAG